MVTYTSLDKLKPHWKKKLNEKFFQNFFQTSTMNKKRTTPPQKRIKIFPGIYLTNCVPSKSVKNSPPPRRGHRWGGWSPTYSPQCKEILPTQKQKKGGFPHLSLSRIFQPSLAIFSRASHFICLILSLVSPNFADRVFSVSSAQPKPNKPQMTFFSTSLRPPMR